MEFTLGDGPFNLVDIGVIALVLLSAAVAFFRGFTQEALSIAGWVGAAIVAYRFFDDAKPMAREYVQPDWAADAVAVAVLFIGSLIVFSMLAALLSRGVRSSPIGFLDRTLGFAFGVARGALLVCVAYFAYVSIIPDETKRHPIVMDAKFQPMAAKGADWLRSVIPEKAPDLGLPGPFGGDENADAPASDAGAN